MHKDPAFLLYYKDILVSCASWSADELGWYVRLLCHQADAQASAIANAKADAQASAIANAKADAQAGGLPNDDEKLAVLAGVRFSEFERFKQVLKQTLKHKFKQNENGLLYNEKMLNVLVDRAEYSENQTNRGYIGALIKKIKPHFDLKKETISAITNELKKEKLHEKTQKERIECYKRTLIAYIGNANANNINCILESLTKKDDAEKKSKSQPVNFAAQGADLLIERVAKRKRKVNPDRTENS